MIGFSSISDAKPTSSTLILEREAKIHTLLGYDKKARLEASGVTYANNYFYVVFDNRGNIARLCTDLSLACNPTSFGDDSVEGLEGITHHKTNFYAVIEAANHHGKPYAKLRTYGSDLALTHEAWLPHEFEGFNKGFEGIALVERDGVEFLLALCEGNDCRSGKKSKKGRGNIHVFQYSLGEWRLKAMMKLPNTLNFKDYSGLAVTEGRLAVVSQSSAKLWVGQLKKSAWKIKDDGNIYTFPRTHKNKKQYCNVEGVDWITPERLVTVTDKRKKDQKKRCKAKDQSIQIFRLP